MQALFPRFPQNMAAAPNNTNLHYLGNGDSREEKMNYEKVSGRFIEYINFSSQLFAKLCAADAARYRSHRHLHYEYS
jgi:hypothetical protein